MIAYKLISVYTTEDAKCGGIPLHDAIFRLLLEKKIVARCQVMRCMAGRYENGEVATTRIEVLGLNLPLKIEIVAPAAEAEMLLPFLDDMVTDGIIGISDLNVIWHQTQARVIPRHLKARDVMTSEPKRIRADTNVAEAMRILLEADFNGLPVVDEDDHPIGIITQDNLVRAGMPVRLGLMQELGDVNLNETLKALSAKKVAEVMAAPAVTVTDDTALVDAARLMLGKSLKRLPVVDAEGRLVGILARSDVYRAIATTTPAMKVFKEKQVLVKNAKTVADVMNREMHAVSVDTSIEKVMSTLDAYSLQRIPVTDANGRLVGMIMDKDLLALFAGHKVGIWDRIAGTLTFTDMGKRHKAAIELARARTAGQLMKTILATVNEDTPIDEAIRIMTEKQIKRVPVVDKGGKFLGMISRDAVLRAATS